MKVQPAPSLCSPWPAGVHVPRPTQPLTAGLGRPDSPPQDPPGHPSAGPVHGGCPQLGVPERQQGRNRNILGEIPLFEALCASGGEPGLREVPQMWGFSGVNLDSGQISVVKHSNGQGPLGQPWGSRPTG